MAVSAAPTVLVTGGCGFIGVNLGRALKDRGYRVVAFDDLSTGRLEDATEAGYEGVVIGDVRDRDALFAAADGAEFLVHLAAHTNVVESVEDPRTDVELNVMGTLNALIAARDHGLNGLVFASSNAPLGEVDPPSNEGIAPRPLSPYGASKLAGEALCSAFAGSYGLNTVALRFSNVYGPYSYHKGSVVAKFMKRISAGKPLVIYGDGNQTRDFVFVDDLVDGVIRAMESGLAGEVFHLGTGKETSVLELVEMLRSLVGKRFDVQFAPRRPGEIQRNYSDITKAGTMLGFAPQKSLSEGLATTVAWFKTAAEES